MSSLTIISGNFTSQERQRVLGQSGDAIFEKHYQSQFAGRDLQHVVLLRPSQEGLLRAAGSMLRKRDPLAPSDLTDAHKHAICSHPEILQLRREKRELMAEMRSLSGTVKDAREPFPHLYQRHEVVKKKKKKKKTWPSFGKPWQPTLERQPERTISRMHLCLKSTGRLSNFLANLMLKDVMLIVLPMKTGSYPSRIMYFLNGHVLWKTFTVPTQRPLMRTSYLLDASRLPRIWLRFCGSVNCPDEATGSIGILMTGMNCLNSQKNPRLLRKILGYVQQMSASFVVVYLVVQHQILLHINFLPSERILFVATSFNLIWFMHMTGLAAIGKPAATCPSSVKSLNSWPSLPRCTHMTSKSNCVISLKVHGLLAALSHPLAAQRCHQNATINPKLRLQYLSTLK